MHEYRRIKHTKIYRRLSYVNKKYKNVTTNFKSPTCFAFWFITTQKYLHFNKERHQVKANISKYDVNLSVNTKY